MNKMNKINNMNNNNIKITKDCQEINLTDKQKTTWHF